MELLNNHRTIRKYLQKEIAKGILHEILESGIRASNTGNMQLYSVIVTRDSRRKRLLAPFHFNQPMVLEAPVLLTICFDINRFYKWCLVNDAVADYKYVEENGKENLANVYTEVRYKEADNIYFSNKLKKMLIDQGFNLD